LTAAVADWLIEPAEATESESVAPVEQRPVVAVIGLSPGCGATTVARALGTDLAGADPAGACLVNSAGPAGAVPLGLPAAARLSRRIAPVLGVRAQACGRLCLVEAADPAVLADAARYVAPLVVDVHERSEAAAAARLADLVVLVGSPDTEPALAAVLADSLDRYGPRPLVVLNRAGRDGGRWVGRGALEIPESRLGAQLATCGRDPRGALARAVSELTRHISIR
jgi:hypothetical protein